MAEYLLSMSLARAGIACVIILTYYASKWYARKMGTAAGGKHIRVIDRLIIGKNGAIMIIDVDGTQYLIGANEHSISILKELDEPIALQSADLSAGERILGSFKSYLNKGK